MATAHLRFPPGGTPATTNVASSLSSVQLLAANANRVSGSIHNDSNSRMLVKLGATASTTSFTERVRPKGTFPLGGYTGRVDAIWIASASGFARVTEVTP